MKRSLTAAAFDVEKADSITFLEIDDSFADLFDEADAFMPHDNGLGGWNGAVEQHQVAVAQACAAHLHEYLILGNCWNWYLVNGAFVRLLPPTV